MLKDCLQLNIASIAKSDFHLKYKIGKEEKKTNGV